MSAGWPDTDYEADLRRLFRRSRRASREPFQREPGAIVQLPVGPGGIMHSTRRAFVVVKDEDMPLLRSLQRRLAGPSRKMSGFSQSEAEAVLLRACEEAIAGRVKDAVAGVLAELAEQPQEWVVMEAVDVWFPAEVPRLVVGRTTYSNRLPRLGFGAEFAQKQGFVPPFATARVVCRGGTTARVLARQAFAESAAVLDLVSPPVNTGSEATVARPASARNAAPSYHRRGWLVNAPISGTRLAPPYLYLSRAAGRDEAQRSDWQRRVLAATRWFSRAYRSEWAADRLVSAMVALEVLFIEGRHERLKGALIGERVTARYQAREITAAEQQDWLARLYRSRNDAAHEGREVVEDLDVDRLLDLTRFIVRYSAFHLDPDHREPRRACRTYAQAMRCHKPF